MSVEHFESILNNDDDDEMRLVTHSPTTTEENENSMETDDNLVYIGNNLVKTDTREREKKRGPNDESVNIDHFERERIEKNQYQSIGPCSSNEHHLSLGKNECPSKLFFFFFLSLVFLLEIFTHLTSFPFVVFPQRSSIIWFLSTSAQHHHHRRFSSSSRACSLVQLDIDTCTPISPLSSLEDQNFGMQHS